MDFFEKEFRAASIIHIPHSSTEIPTCEGMELTVIDQELHLLTDWATEKIFDISGCTKIITPFSRLFCDVERLPDADEPMYQKGRGFYYTKCDDGRVLRKEIERLKQFVYDNYYLPHHELVLNWCLKKIEDYGVCYIIDAHSFSEQPLQSEFIQDANRPDICLGIDEFHTPNALLEQFKAQFENSGYSVGINTPYSGTLVPLNLYQKEQRLKSIMIEVNKTCYMQNGKVQADKVKDLQNCMETVMGKV
jgi:N-formylglutamate amidohydrolase